MKILEPFLIGLLAGLVVGMIAGATLVTDRMKSEAIKNNVGRYNPTNAAFEWQVCK
jgi:hypothetical protein